MATRTPAYTALFAILGLTISTSAFAENLIYSPLNPGLGGNSNNYSYLQGLADIQNQHLPVASGSGGSGSGGFSFPPIVIDLGGVGLPTDNTVDPDPSASQ